MNLEKEIERVTEKYLLKDREVSEKLKEIENYRYLFEEKNREIEGKQKGLRELSRK